jgi:hypothetical protein
MADFFEFSQPIDLNVHQCCAQRLFEDSKDLNLKSESPPAYLTRAADKPATEASGSITPFFGVLNETTPGQPLAFDQNFRKLDFGPTASATDKFATPPIGNNNLQFDHKFSGALIFGLHMKL